MLGRSPLHKRHPDPSVQIPGSDFGWKVGCKHRCMEYGRYGKLTSIANKFRHELTWHQGIRVNNRRLPIRSTIRHQIRQRRRSHCSNNRAARRLPQIPLFGWQMVARNLQPQGRTAQHPPVTPLGIARCAPRKVSFLKRREQEHCRISAAYAPVAARGQSQCGRHVGPRLLKGHKGHGSGELGYSCG